MGIGVAEATWKPGRMIEAGSFLRELDDAVSRGSTESRLRALWHATDLLIVGRFTDDEIWVFGEVIGRLADGIEVAARAQLAPFSKFCFNSIT
jgi:hypothetical protein